MLDLETARQKAQYLVYIMLPYVERIEVAGSIRRKRAVINDIDILFIPKFMLMSKLMCTLKRNGFTVQENGDKLIRGAYNEVGVDLYIANNYNWGTLLLIRTGSREHNMKLCGIAKKSGMKLRAGGEGLFDNAGRRIAGDTEESIFAGLGLQYIRPEDREAHDFP